MMKWDFEYTQQDMLAFTIEQHRRSKAGRNILWVLAAFIDLFALSLLVTGVSQGLSGGHWAFGQQRLFQWGAFSFYAALALALVAFSVWIISRSRPERFAKDAVKRAQRQSPEVFGPWHVELSEERLLICRGGSQQAGDPATLDEAIDCPAGLLVYSHEKKRCFGLPARLFASREEQQAVAREFGRCSAIAKARLLQKQAGFLAGEAVDRELPPMPPLPEGDTALFATPVLLQKEELFSALYAGNRRLVPMRGKLRLAMAFGALGLLVSIFAFVKGDTAYGLFMLAMACLMGLMLLGRAPFMLKNAVRRVVESEQAMRLLAPGWLVLGQNGFTHTSGGLCSYVPYTQLGQAAEDGQYLFLLFQQNLMLVVPKRGFESPAQAAGAAKLLQERVQSRVRKRK